MVDRKKEPPPATTSRRSTGGPLVVACLAPDDLRPDVHPLTGEVWADPRRADLTAADAAALEYALRAAEVWAGRVVAVTAGPPHLDAVLRPAVALGAAALRVPWGEPDPTGIGPQPVDGTALAGNPEALALALGNAIAQLGQPALVLCGDRSALRGTGAVPALLAHHLGASQALGLVSLHFEAGAIIAERRLDGGWREQLRVTAPAVCSVEAAGVRLRRAPFAAALAAVATPIPVATGTTAAAPVAPRRAAVHAGPPRPYRPRTHLVAPPAGTTHERLLALTGALAAHDPPRIVGPVNADVAADELLDYLAKHGYFDQSEP
jgi:electron transfer flavoprotein beta subunit